MQASSASVDRDLLNPSRQRNIDSARDTYQLSPSPASGRRSSFVDYALSMAPINNPASPKWVMTWLSLERKIHQQGDFGGSRACANAHCPIEETNSQESAVIPMELALDAQDAMVRQPNTASVDCTGALLVSFSGSKEVNLRSGERNGQPTVPRFAMRFPFQGA